MRYMRRWRKFGFQKASKSIVAVPQNGGAFAEIYHVLHQENMSVQ